MVATLNNEISKVSELSGKVSVSYKKNMCKLVITFTEPSGMLEFNKDINNNTSSTALQMKLGWLLGFTKKKYETSQEYIAEAPYDSIGSKYIFLVVDDYNNNVNNFFIGAFNSSVLNPNILARIPRNNDFTNSEIPQGKDDLSTSTRSYFGPINIQKLKIQLVDEYGRIVSLNNRDFSISLEFNCIYN